MKKTLTLSDKQDVVCGTNCIYKSNHENGWGESTEAGDGSEIWWQFLIN